MNKYKIEVTRTTYDMMSFDVEAHNEDEAERIAYELAENASWGSGNAEYDIEYMQEVEEAK
jgi:hypothetical protein